MSIITFILIIVVVGVLLWAANTYIPMDGKVKKILNAVVIVVLILWILTIIGVLPLQWDMKVPRVR